MENLLGIVLTVAAFGILFGAIYLISYLHEHSCKNNAKHDWDKWKDNGSLQQRHCQTCGIREDREVP